MQEIPNSRIQELERKLHYVKVHERAYSTKLRIHEKRYQSLETEMKRLEALREESLSDLNQAREAFEQQLAFKERQKKLVFKQLADMESQFIELQTQSESTEHAEELEEALEIMMEENNALLLELTKAKQEVAQLSEEKQFIQRELEFKEELKGRASEPLSYLTFQRNNRL